MRRRTALLALTLVVPMVSPTQAGGFDAVGAPQQWVDLRRTPALPPRTGLLVRVAIHDRFLGTGLQDQDLAVQWVRHRWALAGGATVQHSDIHTRTTLQVAVQGRLHRFAWGGALALEQWEFQGGPRVRQGRGRVAWSCTLPAATSIEIQLVPPFQPADGAAFILHCRTQHFAPFGLLLSEERVAGFPVRRRWGVTWGGSAFVLAAGFEPLTSSSSVGVTLRQVGWMWDVAANLHPLLGWSRAVGLAWRR